MLTTHALPTEWHHMGCLQSGGPILTVARCTALVYPQCDLTKAMMPCSLASERCIWVTKAFLLEQIEPPPHPAGLLDAQSGSPATEICDSAVITCTLCLLILYWKVTLTLKPTNLVHKHVGLQVKQGQAGWQKGSAKPLACSLKPAAPQDLRF